MEYDYIIAAGDSFTEGCKNELGISEAGTWPGLLGKELGIPWVNLADGGASNYEIALQPVTQMHKWTTMNPPKKPLFIFGFTVDHRLPYYDYQLGELTSFFTTLPEEINNSHLQRQEKSQLMSQMQLGMMEGPLHHMNINIDQSTGKTPSVDSFIYQTWQAIKVANNYKNLYADATVMWGFIHSYLTRENIKTKVCPMSGLPYTVNWPYMDSCFNKHVDGMKPLQNLTDDPALWISEHDSHPNKIGISTYADFFNKVLHK
jgi:hypothetical protein